MAARRPGEDLPTQVGRTFMFTDMVDSTALMTAIGDEAWDGVRTWHDRMVTPVVGEHLEMLVKVPAMDSSLPLRSLPWRSIAQMRFDASSMRIAGAPALPPAADEILISAPLKDRLGSHVSTVSLGPKDLKGIPTPIEVALVEWR